jgi:restriction endonuclease Mrr
MASVPFPNAPPEINEAAKRAYGHTFTTYIDEHSGEDRLSEIDADAHREGIEAANAVYHEWLQVSLRRQWSPESQFDEEATRVLSPEDVRAGIVAPVADYRVLEALLNEPERVYALPPRAFEEFVAELLDRFGYDCTLSPLGPDGGVDIYAERHTSVGAELVLVQCKRFHKRKKVTLPTLKQLHADVSDRPATRGLVVTTSTFTKPAWAYILERHYKLGGVDFDKLQEWMRQVRAGIVW